MIFDCPKKWLSLDGKHQFCSILIVLYFAFIQYQLGYAGAQTGLGIENGFADSCFCDTDYETLIVQYQITN